ncbi:hypothetical protein RJ640_023723, partial [Escallonia rubra]
MNSNFIAAPLKHIVDTSTSNHLNSVTAGEIQSLAEQSNYTNIILSTIGEQTTRIEDTIFQVKDVVSDFYNKMQPPKGISDNIFGTSPSFNLASSSSSVVRNFEQPLIKPSIDLDSRFKLKSEEPSGEFLKELMSKLGQIKTPKEKYPKVETSQSSPKHINMIGDIGSESEIKPDKLEKQFITAIGATNSRPPLRNYYTRPTPVDMQLEEKNFSNPSSFNGSSIYEWNLDGMTDYQVITLLQHMLMAANSARNRNLGESEAVIARYLIVGFIGQLRGWWDFYLTPTDQNNILNSIKIEPNGNPILINEQPLSDAVTTLVTAITKHFIGNASTVLERGRELLINLRCPTLTHFRWYKDVFLSKLYQRSDAQQDFWKERFIAGLPNLSSERVRTRIRNKHNDSEDNHSLELNNIDGDINSSCSSSNHSSDHEDTCHDCNSKTDYYKTILDMNDLSINVITSEESIILDLLDKIDDPEKKKQTPNLRTQRSEKEEEEEIYDNKLKINPDFANDTIIPKEQEILSMDRVIFQKWYVSVKVVISKDFTFEGIALIDSGADLNCIKEGLVPTKYCETTRQALTTANNGRMKINYKISESWVCNDDFYQDLYKDTKVLYQRLQKNPQPWTIVHTQAIRRIKLRAKTLPCLCLSLPEAFKIVETDASDIGFGGILKQKVDGKMTPPRASSQRPGKGLLPRPNRYNLRKSIGSSSSQPNREAMLGKFENSGYNAHAHCPNIIQIEDEEQDLSPIEVANNYLTNGWAYPQKAS